MAAYFASLQKKRTKICKQRAAMRGHKTCLITAQIESATDSLLREERRLRVFENRVLRRIFGPKRDEVTGEWRRLHNKELHGLYLLTYSMEQSPS
jgi:hypothetical protein